MMNENDPIPPVAPPNNAAELLEALEWMIENDDTNRGGDWEYKNAYWIEGLERARKAVATAKGEPYERDDSWDNPDEDLT